MEYDEERENQLDFLLQGFASSMVQEGDAIARNRRQARLILESFDQLSPADRWRFLREDPRCQTLPFALELVEQAQGKALHDPAEGILWAKYGVEAALRLPASLEQPQLIDDTRALAWSILANAYRVAGEVTAADDPLRNARAHLSSGSGLPATRVEVLAREATVRRDQRRLEDAEELLAECLCLCRELGDSHGEGSVLVSLANLQRERGALEETVLLLDRALERIEPERDPRLELCARHNLADALIDLERFQECIDLLPQVRTLAEQVGRKLDLLRLRWLEGRAALGLGASDAAERILRETRDEFLQREMMYDVGLLSLELGLLLLSSGRLREIGELATQTAEFFESRQVQREATAAMLLFANAAVAKELTRELVLQLYQKLQDARCETSLIADSMTPGAAPEKGLLGLVRDAKLEQGDS